MDKKKQGLLILLSIFVITITLLTLDGVFLANRRVNARYVELTSQKIPAPLNRFKIIYFSDVHYNLFTDKTRLTDIVSKINVEKPDVVLFGGDLINNLEKQPLTQEQNSDLIDTLKSIEAKYGKFAVTSMLEQSSDYTLNTTKKILHLAEFEVIDGKLLEIHYNGASFNLLGVGAKSDAQTINNALETLKPDLLTLAFAHEPNQVELIQPSRFDYMMAGFTHGGQINLPLFNNSFFKNQKYTKKTQTMDNFRLDISNGVGTDLVDMRLFAQADFIVLTLKTVK